MSHYMPHVTEVEKNVSRTYDLPSALNKSRIVFLNGPVDDQSAWIITMQFLHLESQDPEKDIHFYINSPGGVVTAGMMVHDTMRKIRPNVNTVCMGQACSMGAFLLSAGTGQRSAAPGARIMIHQPLGGYQGQASDILIHTEEMLRIKKVLNEKMARYTGKDLEVIEKDTDRDNFMGAEEAREYGLIDAVVSIK